MKKIYSLFIVAFVCQMSIAQTVNVTVDANAGRKPISPYIYGKNNIYNNPIHDDFIKQLKADIKLLTEAIMVTNGQ